ncbi:RIP metalloprotease RseP [Frigidibacter sp. ROC022]|uniref:RIP metalloprotease RseP n=1 Tax=Frigidibacter sp. ROC022 TaxID=2971796 RepID=UPI00215AB520|nr:RIP metalloprotease RseP [Frigidibacter sp. ROC022]MCR8723837.1 RIP metalloprotease RseP [Frigidibacter sp. ROC022]
MDFQSLFGMLGGGVWTLVFFVVALSVIVTVHELGHYLVGRWTGIGAEVFSLGFGPVLASRVDKHGTKWQLAAIPFGGYVKFVGDSNAASGRDDAALAGMDAQTRRRSVHGAPLWARAATVAAGPLANFLLSFVVFSALIFSQGVPVSPMTIAEIHPFPAEAEIGLKVGDRILAIDGKDVRDETAAAEALADLPDQATLDYLVERDGSEMLVTAPNLFPALVGSVMPNSAAADAGLAPDDVILSVDGKPISTFSELRDLTGASEGEPMQIKVWRDGETFDFTLVPRKMDLPTGGGGFETRYLIGLTSGSLYEAKTEYPSPWKAAEFGVKQTWEVLVTTISGIGHMVTGKIDSCNIQGAIGIAEASGDAAAAGLASFVMFIGFLSAAIGLLNLFPIPVLDGGHLVFQAWEAVTGKAPGEKAMRIMMTIGLVLVLSLMIFGLTNDVRCP